MQDKPHRISAAGFIDANTPETLRRKEAIPFEPMAVTDRVRRLIEEDCLFDELDLGVRNAAEKHEVALQLVAWMGLVDKYDKVGSDSRDRGIPGVSLRAKVADALVAAGILLVRKGSQQSGKITRYTFAFQVRQWWRRQGLQFLDIVDVSKPASRRDLEFGPIVLRDKDKVAQPLPQLSSKLRRMAERITFVNMANLEEHTWMFFPEVRGRPMPDSINPTMRAIFNEDFEHGGRLYSRTMNGYTHLSRDDRRTLRIDGQPIAELDYSGMHPRMLYHKAGIDFQGDVYQPAQVLPELKGKRRQRFARNGIKKLTNIILNSPDRETADQAARNYLQRDNSRLGQLVRGVADITASQLLDRIADAHQPIKKHFFSGVGLRLQAEDARLMLDILLRFVRRRKPALSLHDGLICKESDVAFAEKCMIHCYQIRYGFEPEIKRDF